MSRIPPESLFRRCKLCGADFSTSRSPKASMARHLRFRHREDFIAYSKVTDGYMAEKDDVIGGLAHYEAVKELDGVSEDVYDSWLEKINRYLRS